MRILCRIFGCKDCTHCGHCIRCDSDIYSMDRVDQGWLSPAIRAARWMWYYFQVRKCEVCDKKLIRGEKFCHPECEGDWIPF